MPCGHDQRLTFAKMPQNTPASADPYLSSMLTFLKTTCQHITIYNNASIPHRYNLREIFYYFQGTHELDIPYYLSNHIPW